MKLTMKNNHSFTEKITDEVCKPKQISGVQLCAYAVSYLCSSSSCLHHAENIVNSAILCVQLGSVLGARTIPVTVMCELVSCSTRVVTEVVRAGESPRCTGVASQKAAGNHFRLSCHSRCSCSRRTVQCRPLFQVRRVCCVVCSFFAPVRSVERCPSRRSEYVIRNQRWSNCDPNLPLQASEYNASIVSDNLFLRTKRFHTSVLLESSAAVYTRHRRLQRLSVPRRRGVRRGNELVAHFEFPFRPNSSIVFALQQLPTWRTSSPSASSLSTTPRTCK